MLTKRLKLKMARLEFLIRAAMQALENSRLIEAYKTLEQALETLSREANPNQEPNSVSEETPNIEYKIQKLIQDLEKEAEEREIQALRITISGYSVDEARYHSGFATGLRHAKYLIRKHLSKK